MKKYKKYILLVFLLFIIFLIKSDTVLKIDYGHFLNYDYIIKYPNIKNLDRTNLAKYKKINDKNLKRLMINYQIVPYNDIIQIDYLITKISNTKSEEHEVIYLKDNKVLKLEDIIKNKSELDKLVKTKIKDIYKEDIDKLSYTIIFGNDNLLIRGKYNLKIAYYDLINIINDDYLNKFDDAIKKYLENKKKYQNKKLVAITFDDGPSRYTDYLLEELAKRDVKATFFLVGYNIKKHPDIVKKMTLLGHELGNHTYHHYNIARLKDDKVSDEIEKVSDMISKYGNYKVKLVRPPYGSLNSSIIKNNNYSFILWSLDTLDWKYRNIDKVYNNIINNVKDGDIILLHDLYKTSIDGALKAIDYLKEQDFEFLTVSDLALYKDKKMNLKEKYSNFKNS